MLGRRDDGYHRLDSLVAFAAIHDTLIFSAGAGVTLRRSGPEAAMLPDGESDLVARSARAAADALRRPCDATIELIKRLPVAAGIGGGSADSGATLRGLAKLWRRDVADLVPIAASLGADVPVCLFGRAALVGGIGDEVAPAPALPSAHVVLVNPRRALSTADVFCAYAASGPPPTAPTPDRPFDDAAGLADWLRQSTNDLTAAAVSLAPVIEQVQASIAAQPGCLLARMSGSGATCFGLFHRASEAADAAASLGRAQPDWWVAATPLVGDIASVAPMQ